MEIQEKYPNVLEDVSYDDPNSGREEELPEVMELSRALAKAMQDQFSSDTAKLIQNEFVLLRALARAVMHIQVTLTEKLSKDPDYNHIFGDDVEDNLDFMYEEFDQLLAGVNPRYLDLEELKTYGWGEAADRAKKRKAAFSRKS